MTSLVSIYNLGAAFGLCILCIQRLRRPVIGSVQFCDLQ